MITTNNYQDIQIIQGANFVNTVSFDDEYNTDLYTYQAKVAKDRKSTPFAWNGVVDAVNDISFVITETDATTLTLTLTAANTAKFDDDFEGVWDLLSKKTIGGEMTRELEGDVVISPSVTAVF